MCSTVIRVTRLNDTYVFWKIYKMHINHYVVSRKYVFVCTSISCSISLILYIYMIVTRGKHKCMPLRLVLSALTVSLDILGGHSPLSGGNVNLILCERLYSVRFYTSSRDDIHDDSLRCMYL